MAHAITENARLASRRLRAALRGNPFNSAVLRSTKRKLDYARAAGRVPTEWAIHDLGLLIDGECKSASGFYRVRARNVAA